MNLYFVNEVDEPYKRHDYLYAIDAEVENKIDGRMFYWLKKNIDIECWTWYWCPRNKNWHTYYFKNKDDAVLFMLRFGGSNEK